MYNFFFGFLGYALWHFLPPNVVVVCVVSSSYCCCCCAAILVVLATHATRQLPMSLASWYPGKTCVIPARCDGVIDPHPAWLQVNGQRILGRASKKWHKAAGQRMLAALVSGAIVSISFAILFKRIILAHICSSLLFFYFSQMCRVCVYLGNA